MIVRELYYQMFLGLTLYMHSYNSFISGILIISDDEKMLYVCK